MHFSTALLSLFPLLVVATPLKKRAGGPVALPIPANCTTINPLPHANCGTANVNGYAPNGVFSNQSTLYSAYFQATLSPSEQAQQCFEQCYGYGNTGECKSAWIAYNVPTPAGYEGTAGGVLETACILYSTYLDPNVFTPVASSDCYVNATAVNIYCPA